MGPISMTTVMALVTLPLLGRAQPLGIADISCIPGWDWVAAWLQAQCSAGSFEMFPLAQGFHYIGPTNDTSTQNPCICSTPVYMLDSACGACQNQTFLSWSEFSAYCPTSMISPEGSYDSIIPSGTRVPAWAFLKPSDSGDFFDPTKAQIVGDAPEATPTVATTSSPASTTTSSSPNTATGATTTGHSTTSNPPSSSHSSNTGAIAGGVVGGIIGLGLVALLAYWLMRNVNRPRTPAAVALPSDGGSDEAMMATGGISRVGGPAATQYAMSETTGRTPTNLSGGPASAYYAGSPPPRIAAGATNIPNYNPYPAPQTPYYAPSGGGGGYTVPNSAHPSTASRYPAYPPQSSFPRTQYSGMPEV
ncbi:hypothetical protein DL93DRAFT_2088910 [Clavulina sp. PMI_390]|nr:hypothetical protein DL93DRAFT_2088910 [Clavulina sp. PMI_390]